MKENNKKKVLIFSLSYHPLIGGAELALEEITNRLDNYDFHLITARFNKKNPEEEKRGNIFIHRVGFGNRLDKYLFFIWAWFRAVSLHQENKFEIIWGMMANYAGLAALLFKWSYQVKYLLTLQSGDSDEFIMKRTWFWYPLYKQVYRQADLIQAISKWLAKRAKSYDYQGQLEVVPNGFDQESFRKKISGQEKNILKQELGINNEDKIIISVSRLVEKNGLADLINSLTFLPTEYKLLLVGDGHLGLQLRQQIDNLKLKDKVIFAGQVNNKELYKYLNLAEVFCRPSLSEGFGNAFVEAMAAGLPIIATRVGGIKDFLVSDETGLVCEVQDPQSIATQVKRLKDISLKNKLISNGLEVSKKYSWDNIARQMDSILYNL